MSYGLYISEYDGIKFDTSIQKLLDYDPEAMGWTTIDSSKTTAVNLNDYTTIGNYVIYKFTNGPTVSDITAPINLSVVSETLDSNTFTTQLIKVNADIYKRSFVSSVWSAWTTSTTSPIYVGNSQPAVYNANTVWIKNDSNGIATDYKIYDGTKWVDFNDTNTMKVATFDANNKNRDLFNAHNAAINKLNSHMDTSTINSLGVVFSDTPIDVQMIGTIVNSAKVFYLWGKFKNASNVEFYGISKFDSNSTNITVNNLSQFSISAPLTNVLINSQYIFYISNGGTTIYYALTSAPQTLMPIALSSPLLYSIKVENSIYLFTNPNVYRIDDGDYKHYQIGNGFIVSGTIASIIYTTVSEGFHVFIYDGTNTSVYKYLNSSLTKFDLTISGKVAEVKFTNIDANNKICVSMQSTDIIHGPIKWYKMDYSSEIDTAIQYFGCISYDADSELYSFIIKDHDIYKAQYFSTISDIGNKKFFSLTNDNATNVAFGYIYQGTIYQMSEVDHKIYYVNQGSITQSLATHINNAMNLQHITSTDRTNFNNKLSVTDLTNKINTFISDANAYMEEQLSSKLKIESNNTKLNDSETAFNQHTEKIIDTANEDATGPNHLPEEDASTLRAAWNNAAPSDHKHLSDNSVEIDASKIVSGQINKDRLPAGIIKQVFTVVSEDARLALTTATVKKGDVVHVYDDAQNPVYDHWYRIISIDGTAITYIEFTANNTMDIPFSSITGTPTTLSGYGISNANDKTMTDNNIAKMDTDGKKEAVGVLGDIKYLSAIPYNTLFNTNEWLLSITYGNNLFVVVGSSGTILTSPDGITWTSRTSGTTNNLNSITYANSLYVAVGDTGTILTSTDAITWTSRTSGTSYQLRGITYGNNLFIVIGDIGTILTSPDTITWTSRTSGISTTLSNITYGNNLFVIVVHNTSGTILTSPDGITWTKRTSGTSNTLRNITYGNNLFVVVGDTGTILTSTDGITWTSRTSSTSEDLMGITYSKANNYFILITLEGLVYISYDAINWTIINNLICDTLDLIVNVDECNKDLYIYTGWSTLYQIGLRELSEMIITTNEYNNSLNVKYENLSSILQMETEHILIGIQS